MILISQNKTRLQYTLCLIIISMDHHTHMIIFWRLDTIPIKFGRRPAQCCFRGNNGCQRKLKTVQVCKFQFFFFENRFCQRSSQQGPNRCEIFFLENIQFSTKMDFTTELSETPKQSQPTSAAILCTTSGKPSIWLPRGTVDQKKLKRHRADNLELSCEIQKMPQGRRVFCTGLFKCASCEIHLTIQLRQRLLQFLFAELIT